MNCCAVDEIKHTTTSDPIPLCYCFGFDESHLREEISKTGSTTVPERISRLIREGLCSCDVRNPSGKCCLGDVNRAVTRLKKEAVFLASKRHKEVQKDAGDG